MSEHRKGPSNGPGLLVLGMFEVIFGIIYADHSIKAKTHSFMFFVLVGMIATVPGLGYAYTIKNPFRFVLGLVGSVGLGFLLRGAATFF